MEWGTIERDFLMATKPKPVLLEVRSGQSQEVCRGVEVSVANIPRKGVANLSFDGVDHVDRRSGGSFGPNMIFPAVSGATLKLCRPLESSVDIRVRVTSDRVLVTQA